VSPVPRRRDGLLPRFATARVHRALLDTPVVVLEGPRQCGKTTLIQSLVGGQRTYLTLDDETVLAAARSDPHGLVRGLDRASIDEVQRAPDLLRAIKRAVDQDRRPGRFLLTGSADLLTLPRVTESLAGRMETVMLLPLSRAEIARRRPTFLSRAFEGTLTSAPPSSSAIGDDLIDVVVTGGYPEMLARSDASRRQAWARDYTRAVVARDVRDIAEVARLEDVPRLLRAAAQYAGQLVNFASLGSQLSLDAKTVRRYLGILEQLFLVRRIEPWSSNRLSRLVKTPKLHFIDSGLLAMLRGSRSDTLAADRAAFGPLLETFVFGELAKQAPMLDRSIQFYHYRDKDKNEVDLVLERDDGLVVGIEVKAAASVHERDFAGLRRLASVCSGRFALGLVVYDGDLAVPFGDRMHAAPISSMWR
jgi:uncharacterized protein